jgi:hypothetical protein
MSSPMKPKTGQIVSANQLLPFDIKGLQSINEYCLAETDMI